MILFFYDLAFLCFLIFSSPKLLLKKKYRKSLKARLRPRPPRGIKKPVIWLHAVSMGETKALSTLIPHIRKSRPDDYIFVTTVTQTGQEEAKRIISNVDAIQYLPLDLFWIIKPFVQALKPKLLILVEGDYWLNLMTAVKECGGRIAVVNGKLSEKSMKRYLSIKPFKRSIFSSVDHFALQGESYLERFLKLGIPPKKLTLTGNLKVDIPVAEEGSLETFKKSLRLKENDRVITLGSTHEGEEDLLMRVLLPLLTKDPHLKVLVVPRHPERFKKVKALIHHPQVIVVDKMGVLPMCYRLSYLAIVGGSFVKGIGGHDVFEPAKMGVPTLFGPHMESQVDLDKQLTHAGAAMKLTSFKLGGAIEKLLTDSKLHFEMSENGKNYAKKTLGVSFRTWNLIESNISLE